MAKKAMVQRDLKRRKLAGKYERKRAELKAIIQDKNSAPEDRFQAVLKLADLPRNSSKTRIHNRCALTGRPRGNLRRFNLSRNMVRDLASKGQLPGVKKSSW